jgi:DNA-binding LytR/AlgR family response regulator
MTRAQRVLLHLDEARRVPVDPHTVYFLEADGDDTLVRGRSSKPRRDVRSLGTIASVFEPHGFVRIHRAFCVNILRIREIRKRADSQLWEVRLQPPVNLVLPVSKGNAKRLWEAFGE